MSASTRYRPTRPGPSWGKKDKHCDPNNPDDRERGSWWDHVLLDADSKLIVTLLVGRRTADTVYAAFVDFYRRTDGMLPPLLVTDEYAPYGTVILDTYGVRKEDLELTEAEREEIGYEAMPPRYFPVEINYATVHKEREQGRVVRVEQRVVLGTVAGVAAALAEGTTSETIHTSYVERWNGTQRHFNARKARKVYTFSKALVWHRAVTWLCVVWYNFGWKPLPLREQIQAEPPRYHYRTPAMAAGLSTAAWSLAQILRYPLHQPITTAKESKPRDQRRLKSEGG
jgi:hypothetical protein